MEKFAFILHPLVAQDFARKFPVLKHVPEGLLEKVMEHVKPFKISHITGIRSPYAEAEGWFVACPLTAKQMITLPQDEVIGRIIEAGKISEELGAKIVGLGAFTSVVGDAGITVAQKLKIAVTTGNSYTVATALQAVEKAMALLAKDMQRATVAIIGATGAIGAACAKILAPKVERMILVARNRAPLEELAHKLIGQVAGGVVVTSDIQHSLSTADIVLTVTSAVDCLVEPAWLKTGSVVCDVARPRNISRAVSAQRQDVLVIEGGVIMLPGPVDFGFDFGFPPHMSYACMAETMLLALEGRYENFTLGRELTIGQIEEISRLGEKHGFTLAGFRNFERPVTAEEIERVKRASHS